MSILRPRGEEAKIPHLQDLEGGGGVKRTGMQRWTHFREDSLRTRYPKVWVLRVDVAGYRFVGGRYRPPLQGSSSFLLSVRIRDLAEPAIRKNPVETTKTADEKKKKNDRVT